MVKEAFVMKKLLLGLALSALISLPVLAALKVGDMAPNFTLSSTAGGKVTLADYKGKSVVVLLFFPAAFTGG